jgi:hypothetical protein
MEAAGCCETLAAIYHTTRNYLQKDCNITWPSVPRFPPVSRHVMW